MPDFARMQEVGVVNTLVSAMNQAFFTLSLGIGCFITIFDRYIGKAFLLGESVRIVVLDTFVAITAGLIIFPACFTYGVDQTSGPSLIFITLPNIFANMALGRLWGTLFFLFMAFAALSTVLAVFENIICCGMELTGCSRRMSSLVNLVLIIALSMPCVLGYNLWAWDGFAVFGSAISWTLRISWSATCSCRWAVWCTCCSASPSTAGAGTTIKRKSTPARASRCTTGCAAT